MISSSNSADWRRASLLTLVRLVMLALLLGCAAENNEAPRPQDRLTEVIGAVETSLQPAIALSDQPGPGATLAGRMDYFGVPAVSVAVMHDGALDWARAYGQADPGGSEATAETQFHAGTASTALTALAALRLAASGALDLDADVNSLLSGYSLPTGSFPDHPVTTRLLLHHIAGLGEEEFAGYDRSAELPTLIQSLEGQPPANHPRLEVTERPGLRFQFSSGGFLLLEKLLTDIGGADDFTTLMSEQVLGPLGLKTSSFAALLPAGAAQAHDALGRVLPEGGNAFPELGAMGLWTTPSELLRVLTGLHRSAVGPEMGQTAFLSKTLIEQLSKPRLVGWGLGFRVSQTERGRLLELDGTSAGYNTLMICYLDRGEGAVIMTNGERGGLLARELLLSIAGRYGWSEFAPEKLEWRAEMPVFIDLVGRYQVIGEDTTLDVVLKGDQLQIELPAGLLADEPVQAVLYARDDTNYVLLDWPQELAFDWDRTAPASGLELGSIKATKLETGDPGDQADRPVY